MPAPKRGEREKSVAVSAETARQELRNRAIEALQDPLRFARLYATKGQPKIVTVFLGLRNDVTEEEKNEIMQAAYLSAAKNQHQLVVSSNDVVSKGLGSEHYVSLLESRDLRDSEMAINENAALTAKVMREIGRQVEEKREAYYLLSGVMAVRKETDAPIV